MSRAAKRERQRVNREVRRQAELTAARRRRQFRAARFGALLAVPLVAAFVIVRVTAGGETKSAIRRHYSKPPAITLDPNRAYTATIGTSEGTIVATLAADSAPSSVNNFAFLARHRFFDGLTFHRVAKDFVIQGGDPKGNGMGGPGYSVQAEVPQTGYRVGSIAWAKGGAQPAGSAGSQFFIVTSPAPAPGKGLDFLNQQPYQYGIIGQVTAGLDVAQKIGALAPPTGDGQPTRRVVIKKITIKEQGLVQPTQPPSS